MEAYRFFNLRVAPFEARPDPRFFHDVPSHAEALATLEYTVYARKTCAVVVGESGSGKTLLGQMLAERVNSKARVLWMDGIGQPSEHTELTVYPPGVLRAGKVCGPARPTETTLAEWLRLPPPVAAPTLLVVDNADGLRGHSWEDLLTLVTREFRAPKPASVVLFGLPKLVERLGNPKLVRLRRRIFRSCRLDRLTTDQTAHYITNRLRLAGCGVCPFTDAALRQVQHYTGGNPALINQICDNALIEAFGDDRRRIDAEHIDQTVETVTGPRKVYAVGQVSRRRLGALDRLLLRANTSDPDVLEDINPLDACDVGQFSTDPAEIAHDVRPPSVAEDAQPPMEAPVLQKVATAAASATTEDEGFAAEISGDTSATSRRLAEIMDDDDDTNTGGNSTLLVDRLRVVEVRISDALSRVRAARTRVLPVPLTGAAPSDDHPAEQPAEPTSEPAT